MGKTLRDEDLRLNIIINGDSGRKEMAALERSIHDTNAKLETLYAKRKKLESQGKTETASYRSVQAQIGKYNKELDRSREKLQALQRQQSVNTMTLAEVRAHISRVQIQLNKTDPKTPLWTQLNAELKVSKQRLAELSAQSKATGGTVCTMAERINRYIGLITAGFAGLTFVVSGTKRARNAFNEYDEALNNMRKTTGLTAAEAEELSRRLATIDTRTPQNELMGIARVAGKLGIAKNDLYGFVKAADILKISLGKDLGDDVEATLGQIGKLVTVFHITDEFGIEQAMMKAGAAINELGKRSTANEANIVNFTKRVAGVAATSKISMADITGLGAAVDACGIQIETAGTAINNVITGMYKRTREFAAVAKMPFQEFADLLNKDVNEALNRVLSGMADAGGMENVVAALDSLKIQGARSVTVLSTLANNVGVLREQQQIANQAFEEGTSCLGEFNIMNDSATARMEKAKKAVVEQAVALGEQLTPAINVSLSAFTWFIKIFGQAVTISLKYKTVIIGLTATYAAYIAQKKLLVAWSKLEVFWSEANRAALAKEALALNGARKSTMLLCAAKNLLVGNLKAATVAVKAFSASLGPLGILVFAIGGISTAYHLLKEKIDRTTASTEAWNRINKQVESNIDDEKSKISALTGIIHNNALSITARKNAIAQLQEIIPEYNASLSKEGVLLDENTSSINEYITALERKIRLTAAQEELEQAYREKRKLEKEQAENRKELADAEQYNRTVATPRIQSKNMTPGMQTLAAGAGGTGAMRDTSGPRHRIEQTAKAISQNEALIHALEQEVSKGLETTMTVDVKTTNNPNDGSSSNLGVDYGGDGKWSLDKDVAYQQKRHELKQQYLAGDIATEKEYNRQLLALDISTLEQRLSLNVDDGDERAKIQNTLDDKLLQQKGQANKWSLAADESYLTAQLDLKNKYLNNEIASETEYDDLALQLEITALQNRLDKNIEKGEERIKLEQQLADKLLSQKQRNAQREAEAEKILANAEADKIAQENRRYELQKKKYAGQANVLEALQKQHERNIAKIQLDASNSKISREQKTYELQRKMLQNQHRQELALLGGSQQERRAVKKRQYEELAALDEAHLKQLTAKLQALIDTGVIDDIRLDVSLLSDEEKLDLLNQLEDLTAKLNSLGGGDDQGNSGLGGGSFLGLSQEQWTDMFNSNVADWETWANNVATIAGAVGDQIISIWSSVDKYMSAIENKQLKDYQKNNEKKKKALEKRMNAGLITEAQYNSEVETMDAEYDAYQEELQIKQAKRQKAMNLTQAIISTAVGVTQTLAQWGIPWGLIPAGIMAAMGAAEIALIASTPITTGAEEGGFSDVTRQQDNRRFRARLSPNKRGFIDSPTLLVAENGAEYVIPNEGLQNPSLLPFINTMETARRNGTLRNLNFESVYPAVVSTGRATGGLSDSATNSGITTPQLVSEIDNSALKEVLERLLSRLEEPILAYITMLGKNGLVEMMQKYESYKTKGKL